jgi:hypothetical protein
MNTRLKNSFSIFLLCERLYCESIEKDRKVEDDDLPQKNL